MIESGEHRSAYSPALHRADEIAALTSSNAARLETLESDISVISVDTRLERSVAITREGPPTFSITIFLEGCGALAIDNGEPLEVRPGTAIVFNSERTVRGTDRFRGNQRIRCVDIRFDTNLLTRIGGPLLARIGNALLVDCSVPESRAFLVGFPASPALLKAARDIAECPFRKPDIRSLYLRAKALEALALTIETVDSAAGAAGAIGVRASPRILKARQLIETQYDESWTIERLAKTVGLNERLLKAGFRRVVGQSIHAYLREMRLEAAASMLRDGRSVTDAALSAGFGNLSHFSKVFRQTFGVLPRDYAREPSPGPQ